MTDQAHARGFVLILEYGWTLEEDYWEDIDLDNTILVSEDTTDKTSVALATLTEQYMQPEDVDADTMFDRSHRKLILVIQNLQSLLETCD
jgi:hypothetical protein